MEARTEGDTARDGVRRSKRDRRSADDNPWWLSGSSGAKEEAGPGDDSAPPKKRTRISQKVTTGIPKKQGARSRRTKESEPRAQTEPAKVASSSKSRTAPAGGTSTQPDTETKRRGRPRKSDEKDLLEEQPPQPSENATAKPPDAKRSHTKKAVTGDRRVSTTAQRRVSKSFRSQDTDMSVSERDHELEASLPHVPNYRHIEPRTRQIPRTTISAKWSPLDEASIEAIAAILSDTTRPVLLRLRDKELRHRQGQNILRIFEGRLRSKLRKGMPFPPPTKAVGSRGDQTADAAGGHADELNFESTVDSIESMETMLDPLLHSVTLLEKEKAKEETALEKEYEALRTLESNAKAEARGWRERMKKAHPLAPDPLKREAMSGVEGGNEEGLALSKHERVPLSGLFDVSLATYDLVPNDCLLTIAPRRHRTRAWWPYHSRLQATWRVYTRMSSPSRQFFLR